MIDAGEARRRPWPAPRPGETWGSVLAALERDVTATELLVEKVRRGLVPVEDLPRADGWQPPDGLGPLTGDLLTRAGELVSRQTAVIAELTDALAEVRVRQRRSVRSLPGDYPSVGAAAAYVDVNA